MVQSFLKQYEYIVVGIVALVLVAGASTITYKLIDGYWQSKWDKRELELTQASNKIINETRQREDALRQSVDKLENENAAYKAKYQTVAANADAANGRLLKQINSVLASTSSEVTGIEVSGKTTREAVILLANDAWKIYPKKPRVGRVC